MNSPKHKYAICLEKLANANIVNVSTHGNGIICSGEEKNSLAYLKKCWLFFLFFFNWSDKTTKHIIYSSSDDMLDLNVANGL